MSNKTLYYIWGGLFIFCGLLGFIPQPEGVVKVLMVLSSLVFFVPGGMLLYLNHKNGNFGTIRVVRNLSAISLGVTLFLLVLNFLSGKASDAMGEFLYGLLTMLSAPMVCSQYWLLSLFLWACLLMTAISFREKK
jgi:hypothetical protein